jgi:hypothetical protein
MHDYRARGANMIAGLAQINAADAAVVLIVLMFGLGWLPGHYARRRAHPSWWLIALLSYFLPAGCVGLSMGLEWGTGTVAWVFAAGWLLLAGWSHAGGAGPARSAGRHAGQAQPAHATHVNAAGECDIETRFDESPELPSYPVPTFARHRVSPLMPGYQHGRWRYRIEGVDPAAGMQTTWYCRAECAAGARNKAETEGIRVTSVEPA